MKGIIFTLVEDAVVQGHGPEVWDEVVDRADVAGAYTSLGDYPDEELGRLVAAGSELLDVPAPALVKHVGHTAMTPLAQGHPHFFSPHRHVRDFLLTLNSVIHPEVRKVNPGASPPHFVFSDLPDGGLRMEYRSPRGLCSLAEGMIVGAGAHYGQLVTIARPACRARGDDTCLLDLAFDQPPTTAAPQDTR